MQWVLFGVNVGIGIVSSLVIAVGGQVLGIFSLSWSAIIYSGGVFTFILIGTHRFVFSALILHPLQQLIQMIKFSGLSANWNFPSGTSRFMQDWTPSWRPEEATFLPEKRNYWPSRVSF